MTMTSASRPLAATCLMAAAIGVMCALSGPAAAAGTDDSVHGPPGPGSSRVVIPDSSVEKPGDLGRRAHTNYGIVVPPPITGPGTSSPPQSPR